MSSDNGNSLFRKHRNNAHSKDIELGWFMGEPCFQTADRLKLDPTRQDAPKPLHPTRCAELAGAPMSTGSGCSPATSSGADLQPAIGLRIHFMRNVGLPPCARAGMM